MVALAAAAAVLAPISTSPSAAQSTGASGGVVVIANGWSPPDAGAAAPLAGRLDAAVLYSSKDELGQPTIDALEELNPSRVLLMGGPAALTPAVQSQVRDVLSDAQVERFSGADRIHTAAKAALSAPAVPAGRPVVIAKGWSPPDVGAAAPLAASLEGSVLFANEDSLGAPTVAALKRLAPSQVIIVGGTAALSGDIESQIEAVVPDVPIERLGGVDRIDTAARGAALADVGLGEPVVLADGWSAPDVGIAAPLAAALGGSVLFTDRSTLSDRTAEALASLSPSQIILIGGSERLAEAVDADLERLHFGTPRVNIAGPDRISTAALAALFGVQFSAEQQRFEEAVATITPGEADCNAAPQLDVDGIDVVAPPADLNDPTTPLTVAEVVRIAGGCALVDYVALDGRTVAEVRDLLADQADVFAVGEPLRGFTLLHDDGAHFGYGPNSGDHYNDGIHEQWHLPEDYMEWLWDGWKDENPVVVAVIDSGFDVDHPDLVDRIVDRGLPPCHRDLGGRDDTHGTHVAGIIAAERGNDYGVSGVAPDAQILPIRDDCDTSVVLSVARALNTADIGVVNLSAGVKFTKGPSESCAGSDVLTLRGVDSWRLTSSIEGQFRGFEFQILADCDVFGQLLNIADQLGVIFVAAAGNSGHCQGVYEKWIEAKKEDPDAEISDPRWCKALDPDTGDEVETPDTFYLPAGFPAAIAVANIDRHGNRNYDSNQNNYVSIAAPGTDITSTVPVPRDTRRGTIAPSEAFDSYSGTSFASPFVAGVVAHMLNRYPEATPAQVRQALESTAADVGKPRKDPQYGHGIVRPAEAVYRLGELRRANPVQSLLLQGRTCLFSDDTPNCADPIALKLRPTFAADAYPSLRRYSVEVPRNIDHIFVQVVYDRIGNVGAISFSMSDTEPQIAGHQIRFPTRSNKMTLKLWPPSWNGGKHGVPYELTFRRAEQPAQATAGSIAVGHFHSCAIRDDGTLACWGDDGDGKTSPPSGEFVAIAAGAFHTCAVRATDKGLECWGTDRYGQVSKAPSGKFTAVAADQHSCAVRTDSGSLRCWGHASDGKATPPSGEFIAVAAGGAHTCAVRTNGRLECWGRDHSGNVSKKPSGEFTAVATHAFHTCAIRTNGRLECWGDNGAGKAAPPSGQFTAIAAGDDHSCAIRTSGFLKCWGSDRHGQVSDTPAGKFVAVAADWHHSCAIRTNGELECWGLNNSGQASPPSGTFGLD